MANKLQSVYMLNIFLLYLNIGEENFWRIAHGLPNS